MSRDFNPRPVFPIPGFSIEDYVILGPHRDYGISPRVWDLPLWSLYCGHCVFSIVAKYLLYNNFLLNLQQKRVKMIHICRLYMYLSCMLLLIVQKNSYYYNLFIIYDDFLEFMNNNVEKCLFLDFLRLRLTGEVDKSVRSSCQICYYLLLFMMTFWSELGNSVSVFQSWNSRIVWRSISGLKMQPGSQHLGSRDLACRDCNA